MKSDKNKISWELRLKSCVSKTFVSMDSDGFRLYTVAVQCTMYTVHIKNSNHDFLLKVAFDILLWLSKMAFDSW